MRRIFSIGLLLVLLAGFLVGQRAAQAAAPAVLTTPGAKPAGVYVFYDWSNVSPTQYPVVGSHMVFLWDQVETAPGVYDWSGIEQWLAKVAATGKRAGLRISAYEGEYSGGIRIPAFHQAATPEIAVSCMSSGQAHLVPRYWDASYKQAYGALVAAFGARFDADPRVAWVEISTGVFGETAPADDKFDPCLTDAGLTSEQWIAFTNWTTDVYRTAFPDKQLFLQYAPRFVYRGERREFTNYAASLGVGLKHNHLSADLSTDAYITDPSPNIYQGGQYDPLARWGNQVATAFEGSNIWSSMLGRANAMWSIYNALDKHVDFLVLDTKVVTAAENQALLRFANRYLGRTLADTPSVWVALRDTDLTVTPNPWFPDAGNFEFWLYQDDTVPGGQTVPVWNVGTTAEGRYARRTDSASRNHSMYFDVDSGYGYGSLYQATFTVTYYDAGVDRWELRYDALSAPDKVARVVTKTNTKTWKTVSFVVNDAYFADRLPGGSTHPGSDFRIWNGGDGDETISFVDVALQPVAPDRLVLAQGSNGYAGLADTYLDRWYPDQSFGSSSRLWVWNKDTKQSLMRFDLAPLPQTARVVTATLHLYQYGSAPAYAFPMTVSAYRMLRAWDENTATWNRASASAAWQLPGAGGDEDRAALPAATTSLNQASGWAKLDVTELVRSWQSAPAQNYGVLLRGASDRGDGYSFYSGNLAGYDQRPRLEIEYMLFVPPTPLPTPTATSTRTPTPTRTRTLTPTPSPTALPSGTPTPTAPFSPTPTVTAMPTATPTATATVSPTPSMQPAGRIQGRVWLDLDGDHKQGPNEAGIAGVTIALSRISAAGGNGTTEDLLRQAISGTNGGYVFDALPADTYGVRLVGYGALQPTTPVWVVVSVPGPDAVFEVSFGLQQRRLRLYLPLIRRETP